MSKPNVLLVGTGGVGTIVAYGIDYVGKAGLSVVVRRDYQTVSELGWEIDSIDYGTVKGWKPDTIYPSVEEASKASEYDFVIITTKNYPDISSVVDVVVPVITPGKTTVVLIQNGIGIERPFLKKYPKNVVLSGVSYIGSSNSNGKIFHSQPDDITISYFENPNLSKEIQEAKAKEFISIYSNDKNTVNYSADSKFLRYKKLVYNATLNSVAALTGVDTTRLYISGGMDKISVPAMREVVRIAAADGVELPKDVINVMCHGDDGDWYKPSMLVDVEKSNPIELEVIVGNLLTIGRELEVDTPVLSLIYELLKVLQFRLKESSGLITLPKKAPEHTKIYS